MTSTHSSGGAIHANLTESEFLRLEAEKARTNITASLQKAKAAFVHGIDPRVPMRKHPLIAICVAAVTGFVATVAAVPSKAERELRHLERLRRAMNPGPAKTSHADSSKPASNGAQEKLSAPIWVTLLKEAASFVKPLLVAQITSKVREEAHRNDNERNV